MFWSAGKLYDEHSTFPRIHSRTKVQEKNLDKRGVIQSKDESTETCWCPSTTDFSGQTSQGLSDCDLDSCSDSVQNGHSAQYIFVFLNEKIQKHENGFHSSRRPPWEPVPILTLCVPSNGAQYQCKDLMTVEDKLRFQPLEVLQISADGSSKNI